MKLLVNKDTEKKLHRLQENIPYRFRQVKLLEVAMTHTSAANEAEGSKEHNERLEFLGDAVLEVCISEFLFKTFPQAREGELTSMRSQLVNQQSLAVLARLLELDKCIVLGKGEEAQGGREKDSLLSDAFEALLGAIFLDGGFESVKKCIFILFSSHLPQKTGASKEKDNKSALQEVTQRLFKGRPVYSLIGSSGPEHEKEFIVRLDLPDGNSIEATGKSVKRAEQCAAGKALAMYEDDNTLR